MDDLERRPWIARAPRVTRLLDPVTVPGHVLVDGETVAYRYPADCFYMLMLRPAQVDPYEPRAIIWRVVEWRGERIICTCEPDAVATYITEPSPHAILSQP